MAKTYTIINNSTTSPGNDITSGLTTNEVLIGTPGTDVYFGFTGNDSLAGGGGDDFLLGEVGNDSLNGGIGDDFLFFADNNYFNSGYAGNFLGAPISNLLDRQFQEDEWFDVFNVAATADPGTDLTIAGGDGFDTAVIDLAFSATPVTFAFTAGAAFTLPNGTTEVSGVEALWFRGGAGGDDITGGANNDRLYGGDGADKLKGGDGDDVLVGGKGLDDLKGGAGNDFIASTDFFGEFIRTSQIPIDYVSGLAAIYAGTNNNLAAQQDTLIDGGDGTDTAVIDFEANAAGVTFVLSPTGATQSLPELNTQIRNVEAIWVIDSAGADNIVGGDFDDRFLTKGGADSFEGGGGIDTYELRRTDGASNINLVNNALNTGAAAGDTLSDIENVVGSGAANAITGGAEDNKFEARAGADTLIGGGGNDTLDGGAGADTLNGGTGDDTASYASATARVRVDLLNVATNTGDAAGDTYINIDNLVGSRRGDILLGDDAANKIDGGLGRDTVQGRGGADTFEASANNDSFDGGDGQDTLKLSGARSDYTITQAAGVFTITDNRGASFDGTDTATDVESFVFSDQTRNVADLINAAPAGLAFTQNGTLSELAAAGTVVGTLAATDADGDPLTFSLDADGAALFTVSGTQLKLKAGADIDQDKPGSSPTRDFAVTVSDGKGGTATASFQITIANETSDDEIRGNDENNTLNGTDGDDRMFGLGGNDTLRGSLGADLMNGGFDTDTVRYTAKVKLDLRDKDGSSNTGQAKGDTFTSIERFVFSESGDSATGNNSKNTFEGRGGADTLRGEGGNDKLSSGSGNDKIYGGSGNDALSGGSGKDAFYFTKTLNKKTNVDSISDFSHKNDVFRLENDVFKGLKAGKAISKDAFHIGTSSGDKEDRIIYDKKNGNLYFDRDGSKDGFSKVKFASVTDNTSLDHTDFLVI